MLLLKVISVNRYQPSKVIGYIPVAFQVATLLAAFAHHDHLQLVGSLGFAYLLPSSNLKCFGYIPILVWRYKC
ncbi:MAG: hypothetical protein QS721_04150 [Candidatus Endonucleobacter sp. (ex Gigantidas childressi)]|nr:hypothetical protein [Candidatus Endonucleobacter sp. (ex Gigantidas childressi)]